MKKSTVTYWFICITMVCLLQYSQTDMRPDWMPVKVIKWDVTQYYMYLPSAFIYQDLEHQKEWGVELSNYNTGLSPGNSIKMTSGVAILYTPFFMIGHIVALIHPEYAANGFSLPYHYSISWGALLFALTGIWFLRRFLREYFSDAVTSWLLLIVTLGTNLTYFTIWKGAMSHSFSFSLIAIMLYACEKYFKDPKTSIAIIIAITTGLIVLIRPVNITIVLTTLLYLYIRLLKQKESISLKHFTIGLLLTIVIIIPQILYWKLTTGSYIDYSYDNEGFFFLNPQIINGLFSYRNGWLIYTPIMFFALIGFVPLYRYNKTLFMILVPALILFIYVSFSWWCWWYGGSFGQRVFIEIYPILLLPMGYLLQWLLSKNALIKSLSAIVIIAFINLNLFQSWQQALGHIHYDSMTKEAYWMMFMKTTKVDGFKETLKPPDYQKALKGEFDD